MQQANERSVQMLREEINYTMDSVNSMFGISGGPRYPTKRPVIMSGNTVNQNHIAINNSQIGVVNSGNIQNLNQTIDNLYSVSLNELAGKIKEFSEAVVSDDSLDKEKKQEVLESLDIITKELFQKPEMRKKAIAKALMNGISTAIEVSANALAIWPTLQSILHKYF